MLSVVDLKKRFGSRIAVNGVSFAVRAGETVGLLGPNGAGKTTTLGMINGLVTPNSGSIYFKQQLISAGSDALKRCIGLVPQDLALYDELSAWANLELFGGLFGLSDALLAERGAAALDLVGLSDRKRDRVKGFSGGMKRRLNMACALLHDPELILLDEPTVGVDPQSRNAIFDNLEELKRRGKTLLYTTHYMEEAERLCDRIVIVDHGRVIADDTVHGLYQRLPPSTEVMIELEGGSPAEALLTYIAAMPGITNASATATGLCLETADFGATLSQALAYIASERHKVRAVQSAQANLERVFIALTGHALRDNAPSGEPK